jgi:hypothetical protein
VARCVSLSPLAALRTGRGERRSPSQSWVPSHSRQPPGNHKEQLVRLGAHERGSGTGLGNGEQLSSRGKQAAAHTSTRGP